MDNNLGFLGQKPINFNESAKNDVASFPSYHSHFFYWVMIFFPNFFDGVMKLLRSIIRVMKSFGPFYWVMKLFGHVGKSGPTLNTLTANQPPINK